MDRKRRISRVDVQVSIVTAVLVTTALICVYFFNYYITHEDMINSLKERSHSIYQYVDDYVDKTTFQNTKALTRENPAYMRMKEKLEEVKASTNVRYLYTAEKNTRGEYVYLVDGLPYDSSDFAILEIKSRRRSYRSLRLPYMMKSFYRIRLKIQSGVLSLSLIFPYIRGRRSWVC